MRRMIQMAVIVVTCSGGAVSAQSLKPAPELGQWEVKNQLLVNGKDVLADLRRAQQEALKDLPVEQRAQAQALLDKSMGDGQRECLTDKDVEGWSDPRQRLAQMERDAPSCKFDLAGVAGSTLQFKGRW